MSDLNNCSIVGRLTKDAAARAVGASNVVSFTIANNTGFGQYARTNFFNVEAWGKQAVSVLQWLKKGKQVAVSGVMEDKKWTDQNGTERHSWTITVQGPINMMADPKGQSTPTEEEESVDYGDAVY